MGTAVLLLPGNRSADDLGRDCLLFRRSGLGDQRHVAAADREMDEIGKGAVMLPGARIGAGSATDQRTQTGAPADHCQGREQRTGGKQGDVGRDLRPPGRIATAAARRPAAVSLTPLEVDLSDGPLLF